MTSGEHSDGGKALWGGGFSENMHPALQRISFSMTQDLPLAIADLIASGVYARALAQCGVLSDLEASELDTGLAALLADFQSGAWIPDANAEDIHTAIEAELTARLGDVAKKLHTGRSRNDQVNTAFRMTVADRLTGILDDVRTLQSEIVNRASADMDTLMPAYTHLQRAQPVRLAHWCMSMFWPLQRDIERLLQARARALESPLGVGAISGHPFGIDREWIADELGFESVTQNSIDTVGDRDFAVEAVFACTMLNVHLSRFAEELSLFSSAEYGFITWPDSLATGSSLMPNKKNPDLVELVRGRCAGGIGDLVSLLTLVKGLALGYQRDLQEDKPPVWRSTWLAATGVQAMSAAIAGIVFNHPRLLAALSDDLLATEIADLLVVQGIPFRDAHSVVANIAAQARAHGIGLRDVAQHPGCSLPAPITAQMLSGLSHEDAVERRDSIGGTARIAVERQITRAKVLLSVTHG